MPSLETFAQEQLEKLEQSGRKRALKPHFQADGLYVVENGKRYLSFASNDYLALSHHPEVIKAAQAALKTYGAGATASRLVVGNHPLYRELETALAKAKDTEAALVFGSGYLTAMGVIPALVGKGDIIIADKLIHACMLDGAKNSGAVLKRFKHNDVQHLEALLKDERKQYKNCLILTEHVFSMDGDTAPLELMRKLADKHNAWLMSDDAHSIVIPSKDGIHETKKMDTGLRRYDNFIIMGTLSKTLGSYGGYIAGSKAVVDYLQSSARSLIFSTGLPPAVIAAAIASLKIAQVEPWRAKKAIENANYFARHTAHAADPSSIVPYIVGDAAKALKLSAKLKSEGFWVPAIRPPTVPEGKARLRFSFTAAHDKKHIDEVLRILMNEASRCKTGSTAATKMDTGFCRHAKE